MKRQDFIKLSATGLICMAMNNSMIQPIFETGVKENANADWPLKKGFMLETFPSKDRYSLLQKFEMLHDAGFDGIEPNSGLERAEVLAAQDATGMEIPSVVVSTHWAHPLSSSDPSVREAGREGVKIALEDAHAYGAKTVLLVPGVVNANVSYDEVYRRSQQEIRKLIPIAEELEVTIGIENVWNHFLLSPLEAAHYVDEFDSPWIGWYFDIGNIITYGWAEQWIRILGDRIVGVHIKEFSREKRDQEGLWSGFRVNYLEGTNNWPEIIRALQQVGYGGYGIAEPAYREENASDTEWLQEYISTRMDTIFSK